MPLNWDPRAGTSTRDVAGQLAGNQAVGTTELPLGNTGQKSWWSKATQPMPRLGFALGQAAQAIAGQHQNAPFAQMGKLGSQMAVSKAQDVTFKKLLAGIPLDQISESGILPMQDVSMMMSDIEARKGAQLDRAAKTQSLVEKILTMSINLQQKNAMIARTLAGTEQLQRTTAGMVPDYETKVATDKTMLAQKGQQDLDLTAAQGMWRNMGIEESGKQARLTISHEREVGKLTEEELSAKARELAGGMAITVLRDFLRQTTGDAESDLRGVLGEGAAPSDENLISAYEDAYTALTDKFTEQLLDAGDEFADLQGRAGEIEGGGLGLKPVGGKVTPKLRPSTDTKTPTKRTTGRKVKSILPALFNLYGIQQDILFGRN